jgi:isopentenyl diphosphate isomerase/L-lactate dehydrogenase-like FMN-dependent dehydrogenase
MLNLSDEDEWMTLIEVREEAKKRFGGICRVCPECNGVWCAGQFPGIGGVGAGASFINNYRALQSLKIKMRVVHTAHDPDTSFTLFGRRLSMPVLGAAVAGATMNFRDILTEDELDTAFIQGAKAAGTLGMTGDGPSPLIYPAGIRAIQAAGGMGIPITKPRDQAAVIACLRQAEAAGCLAVGVDVDAAGILPMRAAGQPVGPKTVDQLREWARSTRLPLVLKGIMCVEDALAAREAGVAAIVVSNHGGRVLDSLPGTAEVLPEIAAAVRHDLVVLVDGGVRRGVDVLKMLALGAHGVLVGRPVAIGAIGGGAEGVCVTLDQFRNELKVAMILTGCASVAEIGPQALWQPAARA